MSSSQLPKSRLCLNIIEEHFGSIVGCVAKALLGYRPASLDEVLARTNGQLEGNKKPVIGSDSTLRLSRRQVMDALLVLIQHSCVETTVKRSGEPPVSSGHRGATNGGVESSSSGKSGDQFSKRTRYLYRLIDSACLMRIRIQKYIEHVRRGFGDVGASIVGAFFLYGRMSKSALVRDIIPLLEVEVISLGKDVPLLDMHKEVIQPDDCNPETIKTHFDEMIKRGILELVPPICGRNEKKRTTTTAAGINPPSSSCLPKRDEEFDKEEEEPGSKPTRDAATTLKRNAPSVCEDEEIWRLSTRQLDSELLNEMCLAAIIPRIPENAASVESVLRALLKFWRSFNNVPNGRILEESKETSNSHQDTIKCRKLGPHVSGGERSPPMTLNEIVHTTVKLEGLRCTKDELEKQQGLVHKILQSLVNDKCRPVVQYSQSKDNSSTGAGSLRRYILNVGNILEFIRKRSLHSILESRYDLPSARIARILLDKRYLEQKHVAEMAMIPAKDAREKLYHMYRDHIVDLQEVPKRNDRNPATTLFLWAANELQLRRFILNQLYLSLYHMRLKRNSLKESKMTLIHQQHLLQEGPEADDFFLLVRSLDRLDKRINQLDEHLLLFSGDSN